MTTFIKKYEIDSTTTIEDFIEAKKNVEDNVNDVFCSLKIHDNKPYFYITSTKNPINLDLDIAIHNSARIIWDKKFRIKNKTNHE